MIKHKVWIIIYNVFIAFLALIFTSCEGNRFASGYIYDLGTHSPLDSVQCKCLTSSDVDSTDSSGYYNVSNAFGGCVPDCPDITVEYSREGFTTVTLTNPSNDTIFLKRNE